jgi:hypothetical protein
MTVAATVTDDIPASLVPGTMPAGCGAAGNQVTCAIAPGLAPAAAVTFAIPVTPTAASPGVTNTASVSGGGDPGCPAAARCSSTVVTEVLSPVVIAPRLRVTKESSSRVGRPEVPFDYVITVTNEGTGPTTAVATVSDDVPAVLTLGTLPPGCAAVGQAVTCTVAAGLEAGGQAVFVIPVTPTTAARLLINTAGVTGGGDPGCPAEPRCRSTIVMAGDIGPSGAVQLRLTKTASPLPFVPRHPATFTLTVINEGLTATSADATVVDPLPAETVLVDVPAGCSAVGQLVTCTVPAGLGAGASVSFVLSVTVDPSALGQTIRNQAAVAGGGDAGCPAEERCNAVLDVAVVAAIPLTSTVTFLAIAAALMVIALRRLRLRGRAARAR